MSASLCRRALAPRPTSALKARLALVLATVGSHPALYHLRVRQVQGHQVVVADTGAEVVMRPHYLLVGDVDEAGQMTLVQVMAGIATPRGTGIVTAATLVSTQCFFGTCPLTCDTAQVAVGVVVTTGNQRNDAAQR